MSFSERRDTCTNIWEDDDHLPFAMTIFKACIYDPTWDPQMLKYVIP